MSEFTREDAIALAQTDWWKECDAEAIVRFQLYESRLCMDFGDFQGAMEQVLGRGVWTHEFADYQNLRAEFERRMNGAEPERADPIGSLLRINPDANIIPVVTP